MAIGQALLVIDVQVTLVPEAFRAEHVLQAIASFQQRARRNGAPVFSIRYLHPKCASSTRVAAEW